MLKLESILFYYTKLNMFVKKKKLSVVIVTFNNQEEIGNCLMSLAEQTAWKYFVPQIVVVDNASQDSTVSVVPAVLKQIALFRRKWHFVSHRKNVGFAKAINYGATLCKGEWILFVNPDVVFIKRDTIMQLYKCAFRKKAKIVGGLLVKSSTFDKLSPQLIHGTHVRKPNFLTAIFEFTNVKKIYPNNWFYRHFYYLDAPNPFDTKPADAVSGALMLVNKKAFWEIGGFDEKFFLYLEDIDFCLRAKQKGYSVYFCAKAPAYHYGGASSKHARGRIHYEAWIKSRQYFFKKHLPAWQFIILNPIFHLDVAITRIKQKLVG